MGVQPTGIRGAVWAGEAGLLALEPIGRFVAERPEAFEAEWVGVEVDGVQLAEWRCTAVVGALRPEPAGAVRLDVVLSGRARYRIDGREQIAERETVLLFQTDRPFQFVSDGGFRVAQTRLQRDVLPPWLQSEMPVADGCLPGTALTRGYAALIDRLITTIR